MKIVPKLKILLLLICLQSCFRKEQLNAPLYTIWEAKYFISYESVAYPRYENSKILLTINETGTYNLSLDVNSCTGSYSVKGDQIEMTSPGCTKVCCDSDFSKKLVTMLPRVTSYTIEGENLRLEIPQWGFIEFEVVR